MSHVLHESLNPATTPSLSTEHHAKSVSKDSDHPQESADVTSDDVIRSDEFPLLSTIGGVVNGGTVSDVTEDGVVVATTSTDVDDFLPSCDDVIEHLLRLDNDDHTTDEDSVTSHSEPFPPSNKPARSVGEPEVIRTESMVVSTSSSAMPTALSLQYPYPMVGDRTPMAAIGDNIRGQSHPSVESVGNTTAATPTGDVSGVRLSAAAPGASDIPIVYLLTTPDNRPGSGAPPPPHSSAAPTSMGGASFAVVTRSVVGSTAAANGDTRPVLRFMQIGKRPPGGMLPGPVGPLAGIQLVSARPGGTGRLTPVFGSVIGSPAIRPPMMSSSSSIVGGPCGAVISGPGGLSIVSLSCSQSLINHVVHPSTGGAAGLVRLAAFQPQQLVPPAGGFAAMSPSSAAAMILSRLASVGSSALADMMQHPRPIINCVNGRPQAVQTSSSPRSLCPTISSVVATSVMSNTRPRPSRSHPQSLTSSLTPVVDSSFSSLGAVPGCALTMVASNLAETMTTTGTSSTEVSGGATATRQSVQEKNAYEYERVMDILRYYRELVVERKLPGACLPCKRRKSKPLVSVGPGGVVTGPNDDESSTLPIPPPPPPVVSIITRSPLTSVQSSCSVAANIVVPSTDALRLPYIRTAAVPGCVVNGPRPVGLPLNVQQFTTTAIFPPRFVVSATLPTSSLAQPGVAMPRLVFYTAASSVPAVTPSLPVAHTRSSDGRDGQSIGSLINLAAATINDASFSRAQIIDSTSSGHDEVEPLSPQQDGSCWKSDLAKLSTLASLTSSLFALDSSLQQPRPSSVDTVLFRKNSASLYNTECSADSDGGSHSRPPSRRRRSRSLSSVETLNRPVKVTGRLPTTDDTLTNSLIDHTEMADDRNGDVDSSLPASSLMMSRYQQDASDALYRRLGCNGLLINDLDGIDHLTDGGFSTTSGERLSSTDLLVDNNSSSACVAPWSNAVCQPDRRGAPMIDSSGTTDAQMMTRMARKRHLTDNDDDINCGTDETDDSDVTTWPDIGNTTSMDSNGCERPPDCLSGLHATFPGTNSVMNVERQSIAVREPGCTPTTVTIVTKWTTSRLAVVGPYQSWT